MYQMFHQIPYHNMYHITGHMTGHMMCHMMSRMMSLMMAAQAPITEQHLQIIQPPKETDPKKFNANLKTSAGKHRLFSFCFMREGKQKRFLNIQFRIILLINSP